MVDNTGLTMQSTPMPPHAAPITPMQMLSIAVSQGADLDKLQKLMDLQERWEANEARKAYVSAIGRFKANPPRIQKTKSVSFGNTKYKHAELDIASEMIGAALAKEGISHRWEVEQREHGLICVTCILTHDQGHSERVTMQATPDTSGSKNAIQAVGSAVSYLQRYTLFAAVGIAPHGADDDAGGGRKGMPEGQRADFFAAIDALSEKAESDRLWQSIAESCRQFGDVDAHEELRKAMLLKRKVLA
jgi:hypothetical protein